jgi:hypothetical protein
MAGLALIVEALRAIAFASASRPASRVTTWCDLRHSRDGQSP